MILDGKSTYSVFFLNTTKNRIKKSINKHFSNQAYNFLPKYTVLPLDLMRLNSDLNNNHILVQKSVIAVYLHVNYFKNLAN